MFEVMARLKIREGELKGFTLQAAEMMRLTRELDTKTLRYDWFLSEDGTECEVRETYADADALLAHPLGLFALGDLLEEVGDADVGGTTRDDAGLDGAADVVGVHVAVPQAVAPDDDDRVAERGPRVLERVDAVVVAYNSARTLRACVEPLAAAPDSYGLTSPARICAS